MIGDYILERKIEMTVDKNYFPGWVRKSITFTNDDGNIPYDTKFIEILKPYGILGTFNICSNSFSMEKADMYRSLYRGFGIQNHCDYHPFALDPDVNFTVSEDEFDPESANPDMLYKTDVEGLYYFHAHAWRKGAKTVDYCRFISDCHEKLEKIFGKGASRGFVWPFCQQKDPKILEFVKEFGYRSARKTGTLKDETGFALPADRMAWTYNATDGNLLELAEIYENYPDDGELKFFCFGLHSVDYERAEKWGDLALFAKKYGNRPEDFYYASVDDIFDYEDAVAALEIKEDCVYNPSDITLYIKVDGQRITLMPKSTYTP